MADEDEQQQRKALAKKNIRLAIILGLLAVGIYIYFVVKTAAT